MNDSEYKLAVIRDIDSSSVYHRQPNKNIPIVTFLYVTFRIIWILRCRWKNIWIF